MAFEIPATIGPYNTVEGTSGTDNFDAFNLNMYFGLGGDDTFSNTSFGTDAYFLGGSGNDTYRAGVDAFTIIHETGGSSNDRYVDIIGNLSGPSVIAELDGRHLAFATADGSGAILFVDWREEANRIETFDLAIPGEGFQTFNYRDFVDLVESSPQYAGNVPLDALDQDGAFLKEVRDTIGEAEQIAVQLEQQPDQTDDDRSITDDIAAISQSSDNAVFRFFNEKTGVHFYTPNRQEAENVVTNLNQFDFEGPSFQSPDSDNPEAIEVFRFFNTETGTHFYTANAAERDNVIDNLDAFEFEGIGYHAYRGDGEERVGVHRFFNEDSGAHFYTPSDAEAEQVMQTLDSFKYEGVAFYADGL